MEDAFKLHSESKDILAKGGFNLCKWKTNDSELRSKINAIENSNETPDNSFASVSEDDESFTQYSVGLRNSQNITKSLGVTWNDENDQLHYDLHPIVNLANSLPPTKRSLLKIAAKIFDPLGCLSLLMINLKAFFQDLC